MTGHKAAGSFKFTGKRRVTGTDAGSLAENLTETEGGHCGTRSCGKFSAAEFFFHVPQDTDGNGVAARSRQSLRPGSRNQNAIGLQMSARLAAFANILRSD